MAVSAGVFLALAPVPFLVTLAVFLLILGATRYMSLASISGAVTLVAAGGILTAVKSPAAPSLEVFVFSLAAAVLLVARHASNIKRLLNGTENRLSFNTKEGLINGNHPGHRLAGRAGGPPAPGNTIRRLVRRRPEAVAQKWQAGGAKTIHIVDLTARKTVSRKTGRPFRRSPGR